MSEMVERVARASFACWKQQNSRVANFEDMNPDEREFAYSHARAVIAAMREPTDVMVEQIESCPLYSDIGGVSIHHNDAKSAWRNAIAAALK